MSAKIPVTVLGATGVVGQRFLARLRQHPQFEVRHLCASERNSGKRLDEACAWRLADDSAGSAGYAGFGARQLLPAEPDAALAPIVFSALDAPVAREVEPAFARAGALVFSNASAFRCDDDVPLLIPEVNAAHLELLAVQRLQRGWSGGIVCNPNCTTTVLVMALAPLHQAFGVEALSLVSMQAISGAGYPGVSALDILCNVIPFISGEEVKVPEETAKLLGSYSEGALAPAPITVSASCNRVAVDDGHTLAVSLRLRGSPDVAAVSEVLARWRPLQETPLHSAPRVPIVQHSASDRPQPRRDVAAGDGMVVHIGRLRACPILGLKFIALGHNAERGAAGASVLNAELALARGWIKS
jgi:aspartate-semialdehyde dehydrogenase